MAHRTLRFCPTCVTTEHAAGRDRCRACGSALEALLDDHGALSREFLTARNSCCDTGCRNCPYRDAKPGVGAAAARSKSCERCGGAFDCRSEGCWCEGVAVSPAALMWLQRTFTDCLCPKCLGSYVDA